MAKHFKTIFRHMLKRHTIAVFVVCFVAVIAFTLFGYATRKSVLVTVSPGATVADVANALKKNDLIDSVSSFKLAVRGMGGRIQVGQYDIPRGASAWRIAKMLVNGEV